MILYYICPYVALSIAIVTVYKKLNLYCFMFLTIVLYLLSHLKLDSAHCFSVFDSTKINKIRMIVALRVVTTWRLAAGFSELANMNLSTKNLTCLRGNCKVCALTF